jgi:hypothetical protein
MSSVSNLGDSVRGAAFARLRCPARPPYSPEEVMDLVWANYRREVGRHFPSLKVASRVTKIPYETLRAFSVGATRHLSDVNEERLAVALGRSTSHYRALAERFLRARRGR